MLAKQQQQPAQLFRLATHFMMVFCCCPWTALLVPHCCEPHWQKVYIFRRNRDPHKKRMWSMLFSPVPPLSTFLPRTGAKNKLENFKFKPQPQKTGCTCVPQAPHLGCQLSHCSTQKFVFCAREDAGTGGKVFNLF